MVKPSETLYSISKRFNLDLATLKSLNNKSSFDIRVGELIKVGYFLPYLNKKNTVNTPKTSGTLTKVTTDGKDLFENTEKEEDKATKYYLSDVIGFYDKSAAESKNYYVLFNDAKVGSAIDIYNPMLRRHVKAKVIGKIPSNTYNEEVNIIISASIAKELGIFDTRFKVNVKYEK